MLHTLLSSITGRGLRSILRSTTTPSLPSTITETIQNLDHRLMAGASAQDTSELFTMDGMGWTQPELGADGNGTWAWVTDSTEGKVVRFTTLARIDTGSSPIPKASFKREVQSASPGEAATFLHMPTIGDKVVRKLRIKADRINTYLADDETAFLPVVYNGSTTSVTGLGIRYIINASGNFAIDFSELRSSLPTYNSTTTFPLGVFNDLEIEKVIHYDGAIGYIKVWLNGVQIVDYTGPTIFVEAAFNANVSAETGGTVTMVDPDAVIVDQYEAGATANPLDTTYGRVVELASSEIYVTYPA